MSLTVVMPAWNEQEAIGGFLTELGEALRDFSPRFIVVDDASVDRTRVVAEELADSGLDVTVVTNPANRGHGPSTIRALQLGLESGADFVVSVDGDGQFLGGDVVRVVESLIASQAAVAEGVRTSRSEPKYRHIVSGATQLLVWSRTRRLPKDANTPLRVYRRRALAELLPLIPPAAPTPNLFMSVNCRRRMQILEVPVQSVPRRGEQTGGTTWGNLRPTLPSGRFVRFCVDATMSWYRPGSGRSEHRSSEAVSASER